MLSDDQIILFPNTNSGYGSRVDGMVDETNILTPISHYGITKCNGENYVVENSNGIIFRLGIWFIESNEVGFIGE